MDDEVRRAPGGRSPDTSPNPEMAEGGSIGRWPVVGDETGVAREVRPCSLRPSVGVDRMQRNFEPMRKQVEVRQRSELADVTAKVVIYEAFVGQTRSSQAPR